MTDGPLVVDDTLSVPRHELVFKASRSGGPGGQHVNASSTRAEITWNVRSSRAIDENTRSRLLEKLAKRLDDEGNVRVVSSAFRSQLRNREDAETRLAALLRKALHVPRTRKKTRPPRAAAEARIEHKKRIGQKKRDRGGRYDDF